MSYTEIIARQRDFFNSGITLPYSYRRYMLQKMRKAIIDNEREILAALKADLSKPAFESYMAEIGIVLEEIRFQLKHLKKYMRVKKVKTPLMHFPSTSFILNEPRGIVLIMSPWNYPFQLTMAPLVGAIAAGNCVVVKPSRYSEHTSLIIEKILKTTFSEEYISVFQGGSQVNTQLLEEKYDYIFFTGSTKVGKIVMEKAANFVTPVSLELGGKSPCIVDATANIPLAAKRIMWGKCLNSGQTCVAPDYLLVHESVKDRLLTEMKKAVTQMYGEAPEKSENYCKIINEYHYERLKALLNDGDVFFGGQYDDETRRIAPTVIENVPQDSELLTDEIFGAILPVITFTDIKCVVTDLKNKPKPLALYLFTRDRKVQDYVLQHVSFGGATVNDTIIHLTNSHMSFGGVGESGMGNYHGEKSFETFSHDKSVMKKSNKLDIKIRYAPYNNDLKTIKKFMK